MKELESEKIFAFFERYVNQPINLHTEINNDLQLIGDDADAMLQDFMNKFKVDFENVDLSDYFVPELLWKYWYYKWFKPEKLKRRPLTIGHMAKVAEKGYWFEPE